MPLRAEPTGDGRTTVTVHQTAYDKDGKLVNEATVEHVYSTDDSGLITRMDIVESE